ncbi:hypothetical protein [Mucilaginibacter antarcticus]|uniref:Uncharacterized protein n=1 Tax=Mucilaginibacter antarcticus TaxID=1855725 RepID=A0ABW5XLW9_9SPHI
MLPEELYNRRRNHNNTPKYALLIIANFVVSSVLFSLTGKLNWFFYITVFGLALYNYFTIRRHIHEFTKQVIIAYALSLVALLFFFFVTH